VWLLFHRVIPPVRVWVFIAPLAAIWTASGMTAVVRLLAARLDGAFRWEPNPILEGIMAVFVGVPLIGNVAAANINATYAISSGAHDAPAAAQTILHDLPDDVPVLFVAGWVHPLWYYLEAGGGSKEDVRLFVPLAEVGDNYYILAFTDDAYFGNRTEEAFGERLTKETLAPVVTYDREWTLYQPRDQR
jgi:hypothetical protein